MKLYTSLLLILVSFISSAETIKIVNDDGNEIWLQDSWTKTMVGGLFYDADFVLTNKQNKSILLLQFFPNNLIFNNNDIDLNKHQLKEKLLQFNRITAEDFFLYEDEYIETFQALQSKQFSGVLITSKYKQNSSSNLSWLGTMGDNNVFIKHISKDANHHISTENFEAIIKDLNYKPAAQLSSIKKEIYPYGFSFTPFSGIQQNSDLNENYPLMNYGFTEEDRLSQYTISSQCSGIKLPEELLTQTIMDDFGHENSFFNDIIIHNTKKYYSSLGFYKNSNGEFNTVSAVINGDKCQHLLVYITEREVAIIPRFIQFIDQFEINESELRITKNELSEFQQRKYFNILKSLANSLFNFEIYKNSKLFYQQALHYKDSIDTFYTLLNTNYKLGLHQAGIDLIDLNSKVYNSIEIDLWHAWFLSKLDQPAKAIVLFEKSFAQEYSTDEDLFKFFDQYAKIDDYKNLVESAFRQLPHAEDKAKVKLTIAKAQLKLDKTKAIAYIDKLLRNEKFFNKYQFELLDELADNHEYQKVIEYGEARLAKGYESALLLNYVGDAYNQLGNYELAYKLMQKSHQLAPDNTTIASYYKSLQRKVGKSDVSSISKEIETVKLPSIIENKIKQIKSLDTENSYEYLYTVNAFFHEKNKKNKKTNYTKLKINNESGVANNKTIKFRFDQEYENIFINYFRVYDSNNQLITELDKSTTYITTNNDGITADEDKLINIPVPSLDLGVIIEWAITTESKQVNETQSFEESLFVSSVSNQYKAVILNGDLNNIKFDSSPDLIVQKISNKTMFWQLENIPNYKKTPYIPDFQNIFPWLKFSSVDDNWVVLGDNYIDDIKAKINSDLSNILKIGFFSETDTNLEKARKIINHVQSQISYQAIEFGWRAFIPNKSETTLTQKYGDCKDHAVLLFDLLNSNGIKAHLTLVNSKNDISKKLPSFGQFDHMIVYLPEINGGVFVDVTDKDSSLDLLNPPYSLQDYHALVLERNNSKLVQIPQVTATYNSVNITRTVSKQKDSYHYHEIGEIKGYFASNFRDYLKDIELDELESRILSWVNNYYSDLLLEKFKFHNLYDNSKPLIVEFVFKQEIDEASIKLPAFLERYAMEFTKAPNRIWGFDFKGAFQVNSVTQVERDNKLKFIKTNLEIDDQLMKWKLSSSKKKIKFNSIVYNNKLPAAEYTKLVRLSKKSYKSIEKLIE